jgi:cytochrome P450
VVNTDAQVSTEPESLWDPYDLAFLADPYPIYNRLREENPLYYNEKHDFYLLTRFDDCDRGLPDWKTFSSGRGNILELIKLGSGIPPGTVIFEDPPEHDIHRSLLVKAFTPRRIMAVEPQIRDYCARHLDPLVGTDRFDLMEAVGRQLPMRVIGMLLGIPEENQEAIRDRADQTLGAGEAIEFESSMDGILTNQIFTDFIDWRKDHPTDDLMTELLNSEFEDEHGVRRTLTRDEVLTYLTVVSGAGNETTGRLIGWTGSTLAKHPEQRSELVANPSLIPNAVEELLRFEPAGHPVGRYVAQDVEFQGEVVPKGSAVIFNVGAANRDPRRFPDGDRFDIHRYARHLTFGLGIHYCLGAALARLEGRVAMEELLKRFPEWDVDWDDATMAQTSTVRGWEKLPLITG